MAPATFQEIQQAYRIKNCRHEKYRRPGRRLYHRRTIFAAFRGRRQSVGSFGHRRNCDGFAGDRHKPELGIRLWRALARPALLEVLRGMTPDSASKQLPALSL